LQGCETGDGEGCVLHAGIVRGECGGVATMRT